MEVKNKDCKTIEITDLKKLAECAADLHEYLGKKLIAEIKRKENQKNE